MAYRTTKACRDMQDNEQYYYQGAIYPREGLEVSSERISELLKAGHIVKIDEKNSDQDKELSVKDIKLKLDELGIDYDPKSKKTELLALLEGE